MTAPPAPRSRRKWWILGSALGVLLIAAFVTPSLLAARQSSLETNAVGGCRAYCSAQSMYHRNDWDGDKKLEYAHPYTELNVQIGNPIGYVEEPFLRGEPEHGYKFKDMETIAGQAIDWENDYALCATPVEYGVTGWRTFIVSTNGTVFGKDLGKSEFVKDYPRDPSLEGWLIAE